MPSAGTVHIKLLVFSPVPAQGTLYWNGDDLGTSTSKFQHGAKNWSQFQHWAAADMGANIYITPLSITTLTLHHSEPSFFLSEVIFFLQEVLHFRLP
jgi:hypothetical protein